MDHPVSSEEESAAEENPEMEAVNDSVHTLKTLLTLIMSSNEPITADPRYLLYLKNYIMKEENTSIEIKMILVHFLPVANYLMKNEKKLKKKGFIELLESCQEAKVITSQMSLIAPLANRLMKLVTTCNETQDLSLEDFSSFHFTGTTFTSLTTVPIATDRADASSSRKRKMEQESEDEDDLFGDDLFQLPSQKPMYETYSNILVREAKGDKLKTSTLEDEWKDSKLKLVYWKTEDLTDVRQEDEWRNARKTMILNYDSVTPDGLIITEAIRSIEKKVKKHLKQNGGKPIEFRKKQRRF